VTLLAFASPQNVVEREVPGTMIDVIRN